MATYVVAVSGGVDSVVLLHMLQSLHTHDLIVAHVDHGIRQESSDDANFVRSLAEKYGLLFEISTHALGPHASEEEARNVRYQFLRELALQRNARIMTAHHADDVVETVAINLHRGTGWRGIATHDSDIVRPLLQFSKKQLYEYAHRHDLDWHEDHTNQSDAYLRNRFRRRLKVLSDDSRESFLALRKRQIELKHAVEAEVLHLVGSGPTYSRYFFTHIPDRMAIECLRVLTEGVVTRPQLQKLLLAIKTVGHTKTIQVGAALSAHFTTRNFSLSLIK